MTARLVITCVLGITAAHAQPPPETATAHYQRGLAFMRESPKDYQAAAREFAAAHRLDPDPKYLFNLALAQRLGGECRAAIDSYRAFLATGPSEVHANNANIGIERCERQLAAQAPVDPEPDKPPPVAVPVDKPPVEPPAEHRSVPPPSATRGRDGIGTTLVIGGGVFALASVTFYALARGAASETHDMVTLPDFEDARDRADTFQGVSIVTGLIGVGLITAGVIRFATRKPPPAAVGIVPGSGGGTIVFRGQF